MSKHTPLPWKVEGDPFDGLITTGITDDEIIVRTGGRSANDTRFIVRAVNAHEELLAACREAIEDYIGCNVERFTKQEIDKMNRLRAAIAKAEAA